MDITDRFLVPKPERNIVSVENNRIIYRASALGGCLRSLWASRNGYDPKPFPENFQKLFARGHEIEALVKIILDSNGISIINNQYECHIDLGPFTTLRPVWILGHIDCDTKFQYDNEYILTEIKGFGKDFLAKYQSTDIQAFPHYTHQISAYLHAREQSKWRFVIYQKTHDSAEDSFTRLLIRDYELPPLSLDELRKKVEEVEFYAQVRNLNNIDPSKVPCTNAYPCPYFYLHTTPNYIQLQANQITLVKAIKSFDAKIAQLTEVKDRFRSQLAKTLATGMRYKGGNYSVYFSDKPDRIDQKVVRQILDEAGVPKAEYMIPGEGKQMNIREGKKDG